MSTVFSRLLLLLFFLVLPFGSTLGEERGVASPEAFVDTVPELEEGKQEDESGDSKNAKRVLTFKETSSSTGSVRGRKTSGSEEEIQTFGLVLFRVVACSVGLLLLLVLIGAGIKRILPGGKQIFGTAAMEILGRTYLDSKRYLAMVRIGGKVVVIGVSPEGISAISEVVEPTEVAEILRTLRPTTEAGRSVFKSLLQKNLAPLVERDASSEKVDQEVLLADEAGRIQARLRELRNKA